MAKVTILSQFADGEVLRTSVRVQGNSYPDALDEAKTQAVAAHLAAFHELREMTDAEHDQP